MAMVIEEKEKEEDDENAGVGPSHESVDFQSIFVLGQCWILSIRKVSRYFQVRKES